MRKNARKIKCFEKLNDGINLLLLSLILMILYLSRPVSILSSSPPFFRCPLDQINYIVSQYNVCVLLIASVVAFSA